MSGKSSMTTNQEVSHKGLKYHCQGCDFETTWKKNFQPIIIQYIWGGNLNVKNVVINLLLRPT